MLGRMKKILSAAILATVLGAGGSASALTYTDGDLLLILRQNGNNDVEYDLGPVSALTGLSSGTTQTLGSWDLQAALDAYGDLDGVTFVLTAASPYAFNNNAVYLTKAAGGSAPVDETRSTLAAIWSKASSIGTGAAIIADSGANYLSTSPKTSGAYTYTVSGGLFDSSGIVPLDSATWRGLLSFSCEQTIAGSSDFYKVIASTDDNPPAATKVGSFAFTVDGVLTFTAGSATPITTPTLQVSASAGAVSITFPSQTGVNYRLRSSTSLTAAKSSWTIVKSAAGTGASITLQDTPASATYYTIEAYR